MGRHAVRLDCYRQAGIEVLSVFAQRPREEVFADFSDAMSKLRRRYEQRIKSNSA